MDNQVDPPVSNNSPVKKEEKSIPEYAVTQLYFFRTGILSENLKLKELIKTVKTEEYIKAATFYRGKENLKKAEILADLIYQWRCKNEIDLKRKNFEKLVKKKAEQATIGDIELFLVKNFLSYDSDCEEEDD